MDPKQQPPYPLRIAPKLRERLENEAGRAKRSLNAEIADRLERSFITAESAALRPLIASMQAELEERDDTEVRTRRILGGAQRMFGLLLGRLREAGAKLSDDETAEVNALLEELRAESARPGVEQVLEEKAKAAYAEMERLRARIEELRSSIGE